MWEEVIQLAQTIEFSGEEDCLIWQYTSSGVYSSQSLYSIINFRGIKPVYLPAIWDIKVPPRVHIFLCLLSKNKTLTRDNLSIRQHVNDKTCLFCCELEIVNHLFFDCVVSCQVRKTISELLGFDVGYCYEQIAGKWLPQKKFGLINIISSAALWSIWKLRNDLCFQASQWLNMNMVWFRLGAMLKRW
uniref:Reverse transcriptase zinc-binding domain-containing protein n=1 Tax=Arundo donax TaxID=35708 RepID=A0A0A9GAM3_ARUDO